ncbi:hypothetical protein [Paenibacillus agri]|uniref:Uncharacterized protein n=1 Tax=Paenibacillus agri TaxID=2744309 RepID=A0A850EEN8_9BACL|nr:hypothetical protein [Paenibacillus agri]NUU59218.1 hypothetical protein [Paenibacillus agri]
MKTSIIRGWQSLKEQTYILILLFIYRLLWGYFMYGFVREAVVSVLLRYPDHNAGGSGMARLLFYIEGQHSLTSDPDVQRWLCLLLGLTLLRLLISPFIRAGLLHELHQERSGERGLFFFPGMKKHGLSVLIFSLVEWLLALLPVYWFAPKIYTLLLSSLMDYKLLLNGVPYILAWCAYVYVIRLLLLYMQFGYTAGTGMFSSLLIALRCLLTAIGVSLVMGAGGLLLLVIYALGVFYFPGLPALLIRQLLPLPSTLLKLWGIAAQYDLWRSKAFPQ